MYYYNWNLAVRDAISKDPNFFNIEIEEEGCTGDTILEGAEDKEYEDEFSNGKRAVY